MNTKIIIAAAIGVVIGAGGFALATGEDGFSSRTVMRYSDERAGEAMGMHGVMNSMMVSLAGKTGDDFDRAFLAEMIVHHEGAVDMAEAALRDAKHEELKQMAAAIISAQTSEIGQMREWQKRWYGSE